ncbi:MAG TPA: ABC transporter ATP-binding protein [Bacteroidales bacterium]|nr:ABC transporter ATP-binding protein [Bacteroidales bacterium]
MPVVELNKVYKHFKEITAVDYLSLVIEKGTFLALLGPNGAGKTTLVEMIEGLQQPDSGDISLFGLGWKGNEDYLHHRLGISLQETRFIDKLTVTETLGLFASFYGIHRSRIDEVIYLTGLEEKKKSNTVNLSGGQRQRLALGIALLNEPSLLLLDEPTTGLDPASRREIWHILLELKRNFNTTLILTTHYMEEASFLCDEIVIMDHGKILAKGTLEQLLNIHDKGEIIEFSLQEQPENLNINLTGKIRESSWDSESQKGWLLVDEIVTAIPGFMEFIVTHDYHLTSFECRKMTLEDLFISLTGRKLRDEE